MASWRSSFDHAIADSSDPHSETPWRFQPHGDQYDYRHHANPPAAYSSAPALGISYHPVVDSSTSFSSQSTGGSLGRFIHTQCDHELFHTEYLRSNKASGHKNLRCFPHCCGGHNPKSFCGSGLVVECAVPHAHIALGRFEEVVKSPQSATAATAHAAAPDDGSSSNQFGHDLESDAIDASERIILPGRVYARRELFRELKSSENPFGRWFKGTAVAAHAPEAATRPRFHLNGNRASWHYGWQSSRLNCKNLHVFRVYFFQSLGEGEDGSLQCVASVSSPPFRISSSRKARKTFKSSPSMQSLADSVSGDDQVSIPQSSPRAAGFGDEDRLSVDSFDGVTIASSVTTTTTSVLPTIRSRSSFDLGLGFGFAPVHGSGGDVLPSLSSRLSRAVTTSMAPLPTPMDSFGVRQYRGQPDRKRLTRSASLQSDYYSSSTFSMGVPSADMATRQPRARTFPGEETRAAASPAPAVRSRAGMMSMDSLLNSASGTSHATTLAYPREPEFRPSLPSIAVPLGHFHQSTYPQVTTPVTDMMQLQLGTPRVLPRSISDVSSDFVAIRPPRSPTPEGGSARPRRKRTRSADSARTSGNQTDAHTWYNGPLMQEITPDGDWDLVAQAHALGVLVAIASRLQPTAGGDPVAGTYQVLWKDKTTGHINMSAVSCETRPALVKMYDVVVAVVSLAIHQSNLLVDVRAKMHELLHGMSSHHKSVDENQQHDEVRCKRLISLNETMIAFVLPRVEELIASVMKHKQYHHADAPSSPSPLIDMIRIGEHELVQEPWWREVSLFDDDDDEYPFMEFVKGYYEAVQASTTYQPLQLLHSHGIATLNGDWRLTDASFDELDPIRRLASLGWTPTSWLQRQVAVYESQIYRIVETETQFMVTLGNSLVSSACPFVAKLHQSLPITRVPVDHFPFSLTRRHLLLAHRAWRESSGTTTTTTVLRTMQWPTEAESRRVRDGDRITSRRELLRKRLTTYFTLMAPSILRVRFVVEATSTEDAKLCAMAFAPPNEADMIEYFDAPASWEVLSQSTLTYERV